MNVRTTKNISITMPVAMVKETERLAKRENRTMSELVREALRQFQATRRSQMEQDSLNAVARAMKAAKRSPMTPRELQAEEKRLAAYGARQAKKLGIKEDDLVRLIHDFRSRPSS